MSRSGLLNVVPPIDGGLQWDGEGFDGPHMMLARDMTFVFDRSEASHFFDHGYYSPVSVTIYCDVLAMMQALGCWPGFFAEQKLWQKYLLGLAESGQDDPSFFDSNLYRVAMEMHAQDCIDFEDLGRLGICVCSGMHNLRLGVLYHPEYAFGHTRMLTMQMFVPEPYTTMDVEAARRVFASNAALILRGATLNRDPRCVHRSALGFQAHVYDGTILADCLEKVV